jgi:L-threonylcarbamoyladenylate synthase
MKELKLNYENNIEADRIIKSAANALRSGGVIIYPTDTLYGLGANAFNESAISRVFKIKKQNRNKPISVIVKDIRMARKIACIDSKVEEILSRIWPGPITVVLRKKDIIPYLLTGNSETVALRIPKNDFVVSLMDYLDFPITATSANISGEKDLLSPESIIDKFSASDHSPDLFINNGEINNPKPSTILDLTTNKPRIIRLGIVGIDDMQKIFSQFI